MTRLIIILSSFAIILLLGFWAYPKKVTIAGVKINNASYINPPEKINLILADQKFELKTKDLNVSYDYIKTIDRARNLPKKFSGQNIGFYLNLDSKALDEFISVLKSQISSEPVYPSASLESGKIIVNKGKEGIILNSKLLKAKVEESISHNRQEVQIPATKIDPSLTDEQAKEFYEVAKKFLDKTIKAELEYEVFNFDDKKIISLLTPTGDFDKTKITEEINRIATEVNRPPQEPKIVLSGNKVQEFLPSKDGIELDNDQFLRLIEEKLDLSKNSLEKTVSFAIPIKITSSKVKTGEINNLGIKELIGRGTSTYLHSIPGRVYNVALAASKINGTLIAPGETFSFNNALGDVSKLTGYKEAYVIKEGRTVLGDGGGVCQVSTTLFRAALNTGLPIDERRSHAYRVSYYEQGFPPGLDATVYAPTTDFKFTNNTPGHILIQAVADSKNYSLIIELYGTSDGRIATTTKPVVSGVSAPPPDLYQDDPTLPVGIIKQVDFPAWGAKASFNYTVTKDGEEIYKKTFVSNYRPWQAVYLRGIATQ